MQQLVISVHGIRTFGGWQERLEQRLKAQAKDRQITVKNYKFGYFSVIAFLLPFLRWLVVRRFRQFLIDAAKQKRWDRIDLVGHSFGTHIIAWGLYGIADATRPPVHTILLAGSVLKSNFPWQMLLDHPVKRVVNDCGVRDGILLLSQFVVLFTGMAGRLGFNGGTGDNFRNRFFNYGHSGYFLADGRPDETFMQDYWVPLLLTDAEPVSVDVRKAGTVSGIRLMLLNNAEPIKLAVYVTPFVAAFLWINGLYLTAESERKRAEDERARAEASFKTAHGLLSDFVEVVSEKVKPMAQLGTVESLLQSAQAVVDGLPAYNIADPRIAPQRARALIVVAEIRLQRGDLTGMQKFAEQASALLTPLAPTAESNPEALHLLARSTGLIALFYATKQQPDGDAALRHYEEALGQLEQLEKRFGDTARMQDDWRWIRSLARLRRDVGDLLLTKKFAAVDKASKYYGASVDTFKKLKPRRPADPEIDYELAWAANKYADVLLQQGQEDDALRQFEEAAAGIAALGQSQLWQNLDWRHSLAIVHDNVGAVLRSQKRYQDAIAAFTSAETEIDKLVDRDPLHSAWLATQAWTYDSIGETRVRWAREQGQEKLLEGAYDRLRNAQNIRAQLAQRAAGNARWQADAAITDANIAVYDAALKEFKKEFLGAARDFQRAVQRNPTWVEDERSEAMALRTIEFHRWAAIDFLQAGRAADAEAQLKSARFIADQKVGNATNKAAFARILTELDSASGHPR